MFMGSINFRLIEKTSLRQPILDMERFVVNLKFILGDKCKSPSMYFRYEITNNEGNAKELKNVLLLEFKEKHGRLPKCNA